MLNFVRKVCTGLATVFALTLASYAGWGDGSLVYNDGAKGIRCSDDVHGLVGGLATSQHSGEGTASMTSDGEAGIIWWSASEPGAAQQDPDPEDALPGVVHKYKKSGTGDADVTVDLDLYPWDGGSSQQLNNPPTTWVWKWSGSVEAEVPYMHVYIPGTGWSDPQAIGSADITTNTLTKMTGGCSGGGSVTSSGGDGTFEAA